MTDALLLLLLVLWGGLTGAVRRVLRGARHPGWSAKLEVFVALQRASYAQLPRFGPVRFRDASNRLSPVGAGGSPFRVEEGGHWIEPEDAGPNVVLYFHGGGYIFGSFRTHGTMIGALARACRARVYVPDYRLAPEHVLPAQIEDGCAAFHQLLQQGIPPDHIVLAGDSAGGHLVLSTLLALRDADGPMPAGAVAISPWVDLANSGDSFTRHDAYDFVSFQACDIAARNALGGQAPEGYDLREAPLTDLPPVLVHVGGAETLLDQVRELGQRAQEQEASFEVVEYPGMVHVWHMLVGVTPEADSAHQAIARFVGDVCRPASTGEV